MMTELRLTDSTVHEPGIHIITAIGGGEILADGSQRLVIQKNGSPIAYVVNREPGRDIVVQAGELVLPDDVFTTKGVAHTFTMRWYGPAPSREAQPADEGTA